GRPESCLESTRREWRAAVPGACVAIMSAVLTRTTPSGFFPPQAGGNRPETFPMTLEEAPEHPDWYRVALASIADAVIITDPQGRVRFMNPVAEALTGWSAPDARGQPLPLLVRLVNEQTRRPVDNPVAAALARGVVVGLANHTVLIARDGTERPIDNSAAPLRDRTGHLE